MTCAILLVVFAVSVVFLGNPVSSVDRLYYDADYEMLDASQENIGEDADEDDSGTRSEIATTMDDADFDPAEVARGIYDDFE